MLDMNENSLSKKLILFAIQAATRRKRGRQLSIDRFEFAAKEDNAALKQAKRVLAQVHGKTIDVLSFMHYLIVRKQQAGILSPFHVKEPTNHAASHFLY